MLSFRETDLEEPIANLCDVFLKTVSERWEYPTFPRCSQCILHLQLTDDISELPVFKCKLNVNYEWREGPCLWRKWWKSISEQSFVAVLSWQGLVVHFSHGCFWDQLAFSTWVLWTWLCRQPGKTVFQHFSHLFLVLQVMCSAKFTLSTFYHKNWQ